MRKITLPLLALAGIVMAVFMIYEGTRKPPVATILFPPPVVPYKHYIAGQGTVESVHQNVFVGVPFPELVTHVYVKAGDILKEGDKLFHLDTRTLKAQLAQALQEQQVALADYERLKTEFSFYKRVCDKSAVSEQNYAAALYAEKVAFERVLTTQAAAAVIRTNIERSIIRAPIDGQVLQLNIRVGEFANVNPFNNVALMLFGDISACHVRVEIDEEDAWRVIKGAPATAFVRGNSKIKIPLEFVYAEPYMAPQKVSLSGSDTERVDTRVMQLVYKFPNNTYPIYFGQLLEVYLESEPSGAAA